MTEAPLPTDVVQSKAADTTRPAADAVDPTDAIGRRVGAIRALRGLGVSELARRVGVSPSLISQIERAQSRPSVSTLFAISRALDVPVDAFFAQDGHEDEVELPPVRATIAPEPARSARSAGSAPSARSARSARATTAPEPAPPTPEEEAAAATEVARFPGARPGPRVPAPADAAPRERHLVRRSDRMAIDIQGGVRWERLTPETQQDWDFLELVYGPGAESHASQYRHPGSEAVMVLSGRLDIYVGFEHYELGPGDSIHFPSSRPHRYVNPTDQETRAVTVIRHDDEGA